MPLLAAAAALTLGVIPARAQRPVFIDIGSESDPAVGQPGALVSIPVILNINANLVTATDNTISVSPPLRIVECQLAEQFEGTAISQIVYRPEGCEGDPNGRCTSARGLVVNGELEPITGSDVLLYTCDVRIAFEAEEGTYPLPCSDALASHPQGQPYDGTGRCRERRSTRCETDQDCAEVGGTCRVLGETVCTDGTIEVAGAPLATHTITPIPTPTPTPEFIVSQLAADLGPTAETIPLVDNSLFGESGTIEIDGERISYRAKIGNDLVEAQRGKAGTVAMEHTAGTRVMQIASNSGGAGGGRGCAIASNGEGHAAWLLAAAGTLGFLRRRARRVG
jgi:hypothetical protein